MNIFYFPDVLMSRGTCGKSNSLRSTLRINPEFAFSSQIYPQNKSRINETDNCFYTFFPEGIAVQHRSLCLAWDGHAIDGIFPGGM